MPNKRNMIVVLAALLGALAGTGFARSYAGACSCAASFWELNLEHTTEPDDTMWPKGALLQAPSFGPITLRSWLDAKIDLVKGEL